MVAFGCPRGSRRARRPAVRRRWCRRERDRRCGTCRRGYPAGPVGCEVGSLHARAMRGERVQVGCSNKFSSDDRPRGPAKRPSSGRPGRTHCLVQTDGGQLPNINRRIIARSLTPPRSCPVRAPPRCGPSDLSIVPASGGRAPQLGRRGRSPRGRRLPLPGRFHPCP